MQTTDIITSRQILRNYKAVIDTVKRTKRPAVIVSNKQPQVAIVSLEDLGNLQQLKQGQSTAALLELAGLIPAGSGLPRDLSAKHNDYTWS